MTIKVKSGLSVSMPSTMPIQFASKASLPRCAIAQSILYLSGPERVLVAAYTRSTEKDIVTVARFDTAHRRIDISRTDLADSTIFRLCEGVSACIIYLEV